MSKSEFERDLLLPGSMFNHDEQPNVFFKLNPEQQTIHYTLARDVVAGDELFISYGPNISFGTSCDGNEDGTRDDGRGEEHLLSTMATLLDAAQDSLDQADSVSSAPLSSTDQVKGTASAQDMLGPADLPFCKISNILEPEDRPLTTRKLPRCSFCFRRIR